MKIKILKNTVAGKKIAKAGDVVDVSDKDGKFLISIKKAELVETLSNDEAQDLIDSGEATIPSEDVAEEPEADEAEETEVEAAEETEAVEAEETEAETKTTKPKSNKKNGSGKNK